MFVLRALSLGFLLIATISLHGCDGGSFSAGSQATTPQETTVDSTPAVVIDPVVNQDRNNHQRISQTLEATGKAAALAKPVSGNAFESGLQYKKITMSDGVELEAIVSIPEGPGPHPLIVLPSSWAFNFLEYLVPAKQWTEDGYVVISYTSRGFWLSGGLIDLAGPRTTKDLSEMIDWALANTPSDVNNIGTGGSSLGAGISILAAAKDSRIKAVAAMSGFTDPISAIYVNDTIAYQSVLFLEALALATGEVDPEILQITEGVKNGILDPQDIDRLEPPRSAILQIDDLNRNKPAILQLSSWNDSLFLPKQHVDFFRAYKGDIAMELVAGDHTVNDVGGFIGLPNINWQRSKEWFDYYLKDGPVIDKKSLRWSTINTDRLIQEDSLTAMSPNRVSYTLTEGASSWFSSDTDGLLSTDFYSTNWNQEIEGGIESGADSGIVLITGSVQGFTNLSPIARVSSFDRRAAAVWRAEERDSLMTIVGTPILDVTVTPSRENATIMAYLYDEGAFGISSLISYGVQTVRNVIPGQAQEIRIDMNTTAWDLESGRNLVLVIDTGDARFTSETLEGDTLKLSSSNVRPSRLTLPTR